MKIKCKCGVKGEAGRKCKACSTMIYAKDGIVTDPDPALYVVDDNPITFSDDADIEYKVNEEVVINVNEE